jgi:hypothetical protein
MSEYNSTDVTGEPKYYGNVGSKYVSYLAPVPSSTYQIQVKLYIEIQFIVSTYNNIL